MTSEDGGHRRSYAVVQGTTRYAKGGHGTVPDLCNIRKYLCGLDYYHSYNSYLESVVGLVPTQAGNSSFETPKWGGLMVLQAIVMRTLISHACKGGTEHAGFFDGPGLQSVDECEAP